MNTSNIITMKEIKEREQMKIKHSNSHKVVKPFKSRIPTISQKKQQIKDDELLRNKSRRTRQERVNILQMCEIGDPQIPEDERRLIQSEKCITELVKAEAASIDNAPDLSSICNQTSHQSELESTKQSEYSEVEVQHKYIRYDELTDKAKSRTCNDYALKNFLSQASQREILVPTEKDIGIREYIKNYREIQTNRQKRRDQVEKENITDQSRISQLDSFQQEILAVRSLINNIDNKCNNVNNENCLDASIEFASPFASPNRIQQKENQFEPHIKKNKLAQESKSTNNSLSRHPLNLKNKSTSKLHQKVIAKQYNNSTTSLKNSLYSAPKRNSEKEINTIYETKSSCKSTYKQEILRNKFNPVHGKCQVRSINLFQKVQQKLKSSIKYSNIVSSKQGKLNLYKSPTRVFANNFEEEAGNKIYSIANRLKKKLSTSISVQDHMFLYKSDYMAEL